MQGKGAERGCGGRVWRKGAEERCGGRVRSRRLRAPTAGEAAAAPSSSGHASEQSATAEEQVYSVASSSPSSMRIFEPSSHEPSEIASPGSHRKGIFSICAHVSATCLWSGTHEWGQGVTRRHLQECSRCAAGVQQVCPRAGKRLRT